MNTVNLKWALYTNAAFSATSGILLIVFHRYISALMGIPYSWILLIVGISLLLFVGMILYTVTRKQIQPLLVRAIIVQDWLWVVGSTMIVGFQLLDLSLLGYVLVVVVAIIVILMAIYQKRALG